MIAFAPPYIDDKIINEVVATLKSGWITTGPRTKLFEKKIAEYCHAPNVLCLNSATAGLEIILRWFGVGPGDEVILPAYTYSATANVVMHCGATPVLVDINEDDFCISPEKIKAAITEKTKVIMPVDFAGLPCDYDEIHSIVNDNDIRSLFKATTEAQQQLARILILSDAAHSFGATYKGKRAGILTDISVFSFHAVKNLTTAEGGAIVLNLPAPFDNEAIYRYLCIFTLHGQNKDALAKMQKGNWRYDIIEAGYKCNMTDLSAAIGLIELERYDSMLLVRRKEICMAYQNFFINKKEYTVPVLADDNRETSYHLYTLRINNCTEAQRDAVMQQIFDADVSVNVHFIPLPLLSFYKNAGYQMTDYPISYANFSYEISLPVHLHLSEADIVTVTQAVDNAVKKIIL
ncbi:MAG: DegT/DnrJ/EryC1/StrS family aminotransferase [Bacteroidetes bacterium]|nr:DegT/DnrJ/EryC1/StrS family aminotransferase [Bacteroidota bacterium]